MADNDFREAVQLHRSAYRLWLAIAYSILAVFSWTMIVILTERPITTPSYGYDDGLETPDLYTRNENWYTAVRVFQAIVAILTLPVTSTVCSGAAVVYAQQCRPASAADRLSLRQLVMLADKGWTDLRKIWRMLVVKNGWKKSGSTFLLVAMLLNVLGLVIPPLQEVFLSSTTVKTPGAHGLLTSIADIPAKFPGALGSDIGSTVIQTRKALEVTDIEQVQSLLWSGANVSCSRVSPDGALPDYCGSGGLSLRNMSHLPSAFLAPLPNGFNTGLREGQFLPRINSTATVELISAAEYPSNCRDIPGAFHAEYHNSSVDSRAGLRYWSLRVCMPSDCFTGPWRGTRDRQDFTEELYIEYITNVTIPDYKGAIINDTIFNNAAGTRLRVRLSTTAGYFELPNYANKLAPGPLMDRDPQRLGLSSNVYSEAPPRETAPAVDLDSFQDKPQLMDPNFAPNKGTLLIVALALFGPGSLPDRLASDKPLFSSPSSSQRRYLCVDKVPLGGLMTPFLDSGLDDRLIQANECIQVKDLDDGDGAGITNVDIMENWLVNFHAPPPVLSNVFAVAAFLANQAWLQDNTQWPTLNVSFEPGVDSTKPSISLAGVVVVSVLMCVEIFGLLAMALYAWFYPRWTDEFDALAMMRIGNVLAGDGIQLGFLAGARKEALDALHDLPGRMGDSQADQPRGRLGLGAQAALLRKPRLYEADGNILSKQAKSRVESVAQFLLPVNWTEESRNQDSERSILDGCG